MSIEIERKWRVRTVPFDLPRGTPIRQGYLATGGDEVRVRQQGDTFSLTVKRGRGIARRELEVALSEDQFAALWPGTEGRRVDKRRHVVPFGEHDIEVDVFEGALDGLVVAEVEFADPAVAEAFTAPPWFGEEVTGRDEWSNARLALDGHPEGRP